MPKANPPAASPKAANNSLFRLPVCGSASLAEPAPVVLPAASPPIVAAPAAAVGITVPAVLQAPVEALLLTVVLPLVEPAPAAVLLPPNKAAVCV